MNDRDPLQVLFENMMFGIIGVFMIGVIAETAKGNYPLADPLSCAFLITFGLLLLAGKVGY